MSGRLGKATAKASAITITKASKPANPAPTAHNTSLTSQDWAVAQFLEVDGDLSGVLFDFDIGCIREVRKDNQNLIAMCFLGPAAGIVAGLCAASPKRVSVF